jgi:peptide/nickel transport system permease protein
VLQGDLGDSLSARIKVTTLLSDRLPVTGMLTLMSIVIALTMAVPLAFVAALNANRWPDILIRGVFQVGLPRPCSMSASSC